MWRFRHLLGWYVRSSFRILGLRSSVVSIGGQGPFQVLLTPVRLVSSSLVCIPLTTYPPPLQDFGVPRNYSVSDSSPFRTQMLFPSGSSFVVTLFDSTGFQSGVTIPRPLRVGPSTSGSCDATIGGTAFTFSLNTALRQCRSGSVLIYPSYVFHESSQAIHLQRLCRSYPSSHDPCGCPAASVMV